MSRFTSKARSSLPALVALSLYACSLQDFGYLKEGEAGAAADGGSGKGGKGGAAGANGGSSGATGGNGGDAGTFNLSGGAAGDGAGFGGEAGMAGASAEGGAPAGGTGAAVSAGGVPSAGQAGEGGVPTGAGGDPVGSGGTAGAPPSEGGMGGQPPLVGNLLVNPGFDTATLTGWIVTPSTAVAARHVYTQRPNPDNGTTSSLATWHETDEYELFVSQIITGLEPGTYTFKGMFSSTSTRQAYLFARNCEEPDMPDITVDVPALRWEWFEVAIESFTVSADSCEVGFFVHGAPAGNMSMPDWLNADLFSFEKDP